MIEKGQTYYPLRTWWDHLVAWLARDHLKAADNYRAQRQAERDRYWAMWAKERDKVEAIRKLLS